MAEFDLSPQYKSLLLSPLGTDMLRELETKRDSLVREAQKCKTPDEAFGLLKEASGVTLAVEHLQFLAFVPTDEGSK